jgi:hemerythrin
MPLITWSQNFSVDIAQLDDEHKKLIDMINSLHDAMKQGKGKDAMGPLLDALTNYAATHFSHEEALMAQYQYPEYSKHKQIHTDFANKVVEYRQLYEKNLLPATHLLNTLRDWLITHICDTDKQYRACLKQHL